MDQEIAVAARRGPAGHGGGLVAVSLMLLCHAMEARGRGWVLGLAGACALGSAYGFLQGGLAVRGGGGGLGAGGAAATPIIRRESVSAFRGIAALADGGRR